MSTPAEREDAAQGEARPYVVIKRCLFWRPNDQGYTSSINNAARYTEAEARERCHGGEEPVTMALAVEYQVTDSDMELATALATYPEKRMEFARKIAAHCAHREEALRREIDKHVEAAGAFQAELQLTERRLTASESEVAGLRALLERVRCEVDGYIDGAPDAGPVAKLANAVSLIIDPPQYP